MIKSNEKIKRQSKKIHQICWIMGGGLVVILLVVLAFFCFSRKNSTLSRTSYPIDSKIETTLDRTIVSVPVPSTSPKLLPSEVSKYAQNGYGVWKYDPGLDLQKRLDLMPASYSSTATNTAKLLNFFAMTDIHITDKENPAQMITLGYQEPLVGPASSSVYSPVMMYTTQVLDSAVQTINALNKKDNFDFGISLGDTCNSTLYNELRWYIDVLDGKVITPSSGAHAGAETIDYQKPYKSAGLDKSIPWYQTLGNHDHFWMGFMPADEYVRQTLVSENIINLGNLTTDPKGLASRGYYMGSINGQTPFGDVIGAGLTEDFTSQPKVPAADPKRRSLFTQEWMNEFISTSSNPVGHGFTQDNVDNNFASYSFEPKSDVPVKIIVLDDTQKNDDPDVGGYGHPSLDTERYNWLISELDKGQAEGKLMIISAHIPIGVAPAGSPIGWNPSAPVSEEDLMAKLHSYPNLIAWIAGHRHLNTITALKSPDDSRPELGFWEIETSSLRDFPQQFRTFQVVRNSDNTISILTTDVDPAMKDGSPASKSRSYAVAMQEISNNAITYLPTGSNNAELVKQLSPEMQAKIENLGTPIKK